MNLKSVRKGRDSAVVPAQSIPPWEFRPNRAAQIPVYHGDNVKHRFHSTNCEEFNCSSCIAVFRGREQAVKAGYHPCSVCNP